MSSGRFGLMTATAGGRAFAPVMIDDDDIEAGGGRGGEGIVRGDAAIDGDDERYAVRAADCSSAGAFGP